MDSSSLAGQAWQVGPSLEVLAACGRLAALPGEWRLVRCRDVTHFSHPLDRCTKSGYKGVAHNATSKSHPYVAKTPLATSPSRSHHLGCFATAEEVPTALSTASPLSHQRRRVLSLAAPQPPPLPPSLCSLTTNTPPARPPAPPHTRTRRRRSAARAT